MPSLPTVGGSINTWGGQLNTFLQVAHNADGTLQSVTSFADQQPGNELGLLGASGITALAASIANRNNVRVDIPVIGDSVLHHGATSYANGCVQQANRAIRAKYPTTANGSAGG